ncbi:ribonuclease III [Methanobrevibacter filiformis]|uniref:ribonuclease III n=1 Tax=Methanobrevibacter filiformis TaxID=55758 RepID=A0A166FEE2_9EURY|nr:ribonuclease III [Methanobrevibacter filiformis]KZX17589.1 ribonuclease 3 [Methanobrevibacter filiformis]
MEFLNKYDIYPNDTKLFKAVFVHKSYKVKHNLAYDYERLEFLGDSVLNLLVSEYLFKKYSKAEEGNLTKLRSNFVCEHALNYYSEYLGLDKYLKIDEDNLTDNEIRAANADIVESFLGALFLDQGIEKVNEFLSKYIFKFIDDKIIFFNDYKSKVKEYGDANDSLIEYELVDESGCQHDKTFIMKIFVDSVEMGIGVGKSKKEAEQQAAKLAIGKLGIDENMLLMC